MKLENGKKRVVHIIPTFELGGVQTGILYSLQDINSEFDYKILVIGKVDKEWLQTQSPTVQGYIISTGASNFLKGWFKGFFMLRRLKPDFVITSLWKSVTLSVSYKLLHPKVFLGGFFHSAYSPHFASTFFMKLLSFFQDTSFADSNVTRQFLESFYKIKGTHVIPYFFTFTKMKGHNEFNPSQIKIAYFGRISKAKNVDRAITFCGILKNRNIEFTFDLYGDGATEIYESQILNAGLQNCVKLKKMLPLNHVMEKMLEYDFLLQLSNNEGMALAVVEAMNCGLVPIVTPVGEIKRYSKDGFNAIWLDPDFDKNLGYLADKLVNVLKKPSAYYQMSSAAAGTFINYRKYSESLIEVLNLYLNKNN